MNSDKHRRMVEKTLKTKKSFLCVVALLGRGSINVREQDLHIPNYQAYDDKKLKKQIEDLEDDLDSLAKFALLDWRLEAIQLEHVSIG